MKRARRLALVVVVMLLGGTGASWSDGCFVGPRATDRVAGRTGVASTEQKGIIVELDDGRELLLLQTTYHGPASDFAWIIPVPGEPLEDDVFLASPDLIDELLDVTRPVVRTKIDVQRVVGFGGGFAGGRAREKGRGTGGEVVVYRRMEVGDYDVSVLSATRAGALLKWLHRNGYELPAGQMDAIQHYVSKRWYFVALKILPRVAAAKPVMDDVAPIGICFPADELVYPLYISRASSRQKTALLLVVFADSPVDCEQLAWARLPIGRKFPPGTSYARIRRRVVEKRRVTAVREFRGMRSVPVDDTYYRKDLGEVPQTAALERRWGTRLWTVLDRDEMVDLTFRESVSKTRQVLVERAASMGATFARSPLAVILAAVVFVLAAVWGAGKYPLPAWVVRFGVVLGACGFLLDGGGASMLGILVVASLALVFSGRLALPRKPRDAEVTEEGTDEVPVPALERQKMVRWTLLAAAWVGFAICIWTKAPAPTMSGAYMWRPLVAAYYAFVSVFSLPLLLTALELAWIVLVYILLTRELRHWKREVVRLFREALVVFVLFLLVGVVMLVHVPGIFGVPGDLDSANGWVFLLLQLAVIVSFLAVVSFALVAPFATVSSRAIGQALAQAMAFAGLLAIASQVRLAMPAEAGVANASRGAVKKLDAALTELDDAVLRFVGDTGCLPEALKDLTATASPARGLDSSGNVVPLAGAYRGPYLHRLPSDPLTRRNTTWVYEVTGAPMIESGAFATSVSYDTGPFIVPPRRRPRQ